MKNAESGVYATTFWVLRGCADDLKEGVIPDYRP